MLNKPFSYFTKQIHKIYLTHKPKSFISKILCNLIAISLLFLSIILITNEFTYLNDGNIHKFSTKPNIAINNANKIKIDRRRVVENNSKFKINSNPNISDPIYIPLKKPWAFLNMDTLALNHFSSPSISNGYSNCCVFPSFFIISKAFSSN